MMHIAFKPRVLALPFGWSLGRPDQDWRWAVSFGPFHLIRHADREASE